MSEFFQMGGYGAYVWPAYGISFAVLAGLAVAVWRRTAGLRRRRSKLVQNAASAPACEAS